MTKVINRGQSVGIKPRESGWRSKPHRPGKLGPPTPGAILNPVCREGWDLVNGSFVFVEQGQQSRDKLMSSGQNVAVKGQTVGYYLFKRCDANRRVA
ncbi:MULTISPECIES: hypothetical protein [Amycolatopsis]|uniref:Uncharacterized protein n=2 Tax=Amycolatopsis TaxID=1813 RepID=A0A1I3X6N5_9PSEU|nr:hypothetical protein [Amycolatopsis sacchari]SFK14967.1 hypothetical protein SAMN05421835_114175 [Amycolatopsis sacchari]